MAVVARSAHADFDTTQALTGPQISGLRAGEDIPRGAPCRIHTDGKIYRAVGAAANALARVRGFAARNAKAGQPLTLLGPGNRFGYGDNLTPGVDLYLGVAAGTLDNAPTTGGTAPIAFTVDSEDIIVGALQ